MHGRVRMQKNLMSPLHITNKQLSNYMIHFFNHCKILPYIWLYWQWKLKFFCSKSYFRYNAKEARSGDQICELQLANKIVQSKSINNSMDSFSSSGRAAVFHSSGLIQLKHHD